MTFEDVINPDDREAAGDVTSPLAEDAIPPAPPEASEAQADSDSRHVDDAEPVVAAEPAAASEPIGIPEPIVAAESITASEPTGTTEPVVAAEPAAASEPTGIPEPIVAAESTTASEPTGTTEPVVAAEPTAASEPTGIPEPIVAAESTTASEPTGTPEPVVAAEPAAASEPTGTTEPVVAAEPAAASEPAGIPEPGNDTEAPAHDRVAADWDLQRPGVEAVAEIELGDGIAVIVPSAAVPAGDVVSEKPAPGSSALDDDWNRAQALLESQEILEARVTGYNQGGLTVAFGRLRGFVPNSHLSMVPRNATPDQHQEILSALVGKMIPIRVLEVQRKRRRLLLSERLAERAWRERQREDLINQLHVGDRVSGRVRSITNFGVFVDLGGADGLIHLSELTWHRVKNPQEVVAVGEEVSVEIIRIEPARGRIGLSRRRALPNPWDRIEQRYRPGQLVTVQITNMVSFGAFAQIEPGIEGLIHISELSDDYIDHPRQVVQRGQEYTARVLEIDHDHERISLSLKQAPQWLVAPAAAPVMVGSDDLDTEPDDA